MQRMKINVVLLYIVVILLQSDNDLDKTKHNEIQDTVSRTVA